MAFICLCITHCNILLCFSGKGHGPGPRRETIRTAVRCIVEDKALWKPHGNWYIPSWHLSTNSIPIERRNQLRAHGCLALLQILTDNNGPHPISPILLLMILGTRNMLSPDPSFFGILDPALYSQLKPWLEYDQAIPLRLSATEPNLRALLIECEVNVSFI